MKKYVDAMFRLLLVLCCFISTNCFGQESGVQIARKILNASELVRDIPGASIDSFCEGIERIEASALVKVPYPQMSTWRQSMFLHAVTEWVKLYPSEEHYRTETILKGSDAQCLGTIAQLYIVTPLEIDVILAREATVRLKEIETLMREGINKKSSEVSNALSKKYSVLGEDFSLGAIDELLFLSYAPPLDDDINYKLKYPLDTKRFNSLKQQVSNIIEKTNIDIPDIGDSDISRLLQLKNEGKTEEANRYIRSLAENMRRGVRFSFSTSTQQQCNDLIFKSYGEVLPAKIHNEYRRFGSDIERLVDSSLVSAAADERSKIGREQMKKRHDERRKEWDMIVAADPKGTPIEIYEFPEPNRNRLLIFLIGNSLFLIIFSIIFFLRWLKRSRT